MLVTITLLILVTTKEIRGDQGVPSQPGDSEAGRGDNVDSEVADSCRAWGAPGNRNSEGEASNGAPREAAM